MSDEILAEQIWLTCFGLGADPIELAAEIVDMEGFGLGQTWIWEAKRGQIRRPNGRDLAQKIASTIIALWRAPAYY